MVVTDINLLRTFKGLMDELYALEQDVHEDLVVYRWRPVSIQLPALWNWITPSPLTQKDTIRWRNDFNILTRIGVGYSDDQMAYLEEYADAFMEHMDAALYRGQPLGNTAYSVQRQDMSSFAEDFGGVPVLGLQFLINAWSDRRITPNS